MSGLFEQPIKTIMRKNFATAKKDQSLGEVVELMLKKGISFIPVIDEFDVVIGTITGRDLAKIFNVPGVPGAIMKLSGESIDACMSKPVREIMTAQPITIEEESPVSDAARIFANNHIHYIPIVNRGGVIVGILSLLDIISQQSKE